MRRRTILAALVALVAALAVLAGVRLYPSSSPDAGFASPDGDLTCSVRTPDCLSGEVEAFKMWSTGNSHAGTVAGSSYPHKVCCSGPAGLSTDATGCYGTALTLSDTDNAHAAEAGGYATEVTLSVSGWETAVECIYDTACDGGAGYACVATLSGSDNAHVADCTAGYSTKVCCRAKPDMNSDAVIDNGPGIAGDDITVANAIADDEGDSCEGDGDTDNDGLADGDEDPLANCGSFDGTPAGHPNPIGGDVTNDDDGDGNPAPGMGSDGADNGPSWDTDNDGAMDGAECVLGHNPRDAGDTPSTADCGGTGDTDGDGLLDAWESCGWGTDHTNVNSDGDGPGDCAEAADVDGNSIVDFIGDALDYARAALLPTTAFGKTMDFDINKDGVVDFVGDVIQEAKFALIVGLCQ